MIKMSFTSRFALVGALCLAALTGCGGGSSSSSPPAVSNPFMGSYKGVFYVTAGNNVGDARFFSLNVLSDGTISSNTSSLNAATGTVKSDGKIVFARREADGSTTSANGQLLQSGIGTLLVTNSGSSDFLASLSRLTNKTTTFDGNYFGTTRVRTGIGIGNVEAIAVSVANNGNATLLLTAANGTTRQLSGTANLTTGILTAAAPTGAAPLTFNVQLVKTGQAGGTFDTTSSRGTVALNKS